MQTENQNIITGEQASDYAAKTSACIWGYEREPQFQDVLAEYGSLEQPNADNAAAPNGK